ncbi:MAG: ABC transporter ATP-binding protein [Clostridia bacterium]|nr:ABC transporter ATP-binding protein [Clostridia bacterium]
MEQILTEQVKPQAKQPEVVIRISDASVRFNIAGEKLDDLKEFFIKLVKRELRFKEFYALKNINLTIRKGESWALIGSNGAGKSTLLKLICGILTPYRGTVTVKGEIAPLIELGAGFDPNLTAEENIFINGAILGHSRKFMREQYESIVEFAELQDFMALPIKNYSSGMRARLGFAVATVTAPDILIVDEVLAVGDAAFQQKCRDRIRELLGRGTTLLFVSHAKPPVMELCEKAVWMDHGEIKKIGATEHVYWAYEQYLNEMKNK